MFAWLSSSGLIWLFPCVNIILGIRNIFSHNVSTELLFIFNMLYSRVLRQAVRGSDRSELNFQLG